MKHILYTFCALFVSFSLFATAPFEANELNQLPHNEVGKKHARLGIHLEKAQPLTRRVNLQSLDDQQKTVKHSVAHYIQNNVPTLKLDSTIEKNSLEVPIAKQVYTYNSKGNLTAEKEYERDDNSSQWVGSYKYEYTFDSKDNIT